ncbi:FG-GAP-like repeat-containing protein [Streptomyces sp. NPDC093071]|uniref:FG-GAP-like repeat-containing protein n=1 Tax=Streptomyces sp. NPDC093071 TaxID=3366022 RepID=UPI003814F31C
MFPTRASRRRLTAAVVAVLAVTGGALTAPAASAAPTPAPPTAQTQAQTQSQTTVPFPRDSIVMGSGPTGFLSAGNTGAERGPYRWTRYADGVTTELAGKPYAGVMGTDLVAKREGDVVELYDLATGAAPLRFDTAALPGRSLRGIAGTTLVMTAANAAGGTGVRLVGAGPDGPVEREVTGLPEDADVTRVDVDSPTAFVVLYGSAEGGARQERAAVVDVASGVVVERYGASGTGPLSDTALSPAHLAVVEHPTAGTTVLAVTRRDTGATERFPLPHADRLLIGLVGDWVTYALPGGAGTTVPHALHPLTARSLTTGGTVKLLDHVAEGVTGPGGAPVLRGGTLDGGEGLYRIAPGPDGTPAAALVASTGEPTALTLVAQDVPEKAVFDPATGPFRMSWTLSRRADASLKLTHTASGKVLRPSLSSLAGNGHGLDWNGIFPNDVTAYNGRYAWEFTARPLNGIGPAVTRSGTFEVARTPTAHDFNDNGTPDLLVGDDEGVRVYDGNQVLRGRAPVTLDTTRLSYDGSDYDRVLAPGNLGGSPHADLVARDRSGVLWLHQGAGRALAPRVRVGGGWQVYDRLAGGSDLNGDGRPDLVATDKAGDLWLYKGTGNTSAPFAARTKIGFGWGIYNQITAVGNIAGAAAGDLVARDKDGVLWLYLGKGDGTFAARTKIGGGWNAYTAVVGLGDADADGRADAVAYDAQGQAYLYKGTGDWRAPFEGRATIANAALMTGGPHLF